MTAARVSDLYRTAFVTGASTGLGRAFAEMLLDDGVSVWGTSRDTQRLAALASRERFSAVALDLRSGDEAEKTFQHSAQQAGGFDLVINNAGYGAFGEFAAADFSVWEEQLRVMLINTARITHAALRHFRERSPDAPQGALVNISSLAVEFPLPFQAAYNMTKAGLTALNESLMMEVAARIVILDVRPGDYRTDFEPSVLRPAGAGASPRAQRAWAAFERLMKSGPAPAHAAASLRRALLRRRSGTVRTGRFFQAVAAPFLARFGSLRLKRRIQAGYFDVS